MPKEVINLEENTNTSPPSKQNPMLIGGVIVTIFVIGVVVLGMRGTTQQAPDENSTTGQVRVVPEGEENEIMLGEEAAMAENTIEVEGGAFYLKPNEIRVKVGVPVTINLNAIDLMHDFVVDELDIRTEVTPGGQSSTVTFTPTEPGEYEFYCSVGNHRAQGMKGTLIIE